MGKFERRTWTSIAHALHSPLSLGASWSTERMCPGLLSCAESLARGLSHQKGLQQVQWGSVLEAHVPAELSQFFHYNFISNKIIVLSPTAFYYCPISQLVQIQCYLLGSPKQ